MSNEYTHPISRLPPESLADIFYLVAADGVQLVHRIPSPWRLALVCKLWRDVVLSTPRLWSKVTVQLDPIRVSRIGIRGEAMVAAWKLCLARSGDCPLTLTIYAYSKETMAFVPTLLEPLMAHVGHWGTMTFGFPIEILLPFISDSNLRYPRLRRLTTHGREPTPENQHPPQIPLFHHAPLLTQLSLYEFPYPLAGLQFPWSQVTDLTMFMNGGDTHELLNVLRSTPNLSCLEFSKFFGAPSSNDSEVQSNSILNLPHLQKLSWMTYMFNNTLFFNSIDAPRLHDIEFQYQDAKSDPDAVQRFFLRSKCTITVLTLNRTSSYLASSFLSILPDVEVLTMYSFTIDEELMHKLTYDESMPSWVGTSIKRIVMVDWPSREKSYIDALIAMVQSRLRIPQNVGLNGQKRARKLDSLCLVDTVYPGIDTSQVESAQAYKMLQDRLSPEETVLVTHKERIIEEQF